MPDAKQSNPAALPLEPSSDPDTRIAQLEQALDWAMDMLAHLGVGYMPGDALLSSPWRKRGGARS